MSTVAAVALAACGGSSGDESGAESSQDFRFKAQALAQADRQAGATAPAELSATERAEVQQRSREWGAASLLSPQLYTVGGPILNPGNGATIPALHFARAFTLQAAAQGETLLALQAATPAPSSGAVAAALQGGLQRTVSAGEDAVLTPAFIDSVTARQWPGTFSDLTLQPLTNTQLQARAAQLNHQLRASVADRALGQWPWPQVADIHASWQSPVEGWVEVAMLRIQAPTRTVSGPAWAGQAMRLAGGQWLLKIEPTGPLASWSAAGLAEALASATQSLLQTPVADLVDTPWDLPRMSFRGSSEMNDTRGMGLALNEVNANLRGLDGGGTFARLFAEPTSGAAAEISVTLNAAGLGYGGSQGVDFIYSPINIFGPAFYGSGSTTLEFGSVYFGLPPCPTNTVDLRPFFLALLQPNGNLTLLARLTSFSGSRCVKP